MLKGETAFDTVMYLAFFILVIFLTRFTVIRLARTNRMHRGENMHVIERTDIDKGKSVVLLKAGGHVYLLGFTENDITLIDTLDPENVAVEQSSPENHSFEKMLGKFLKGGVMYKKNK